MVFAFVIFVLILVVYLPIAWYIYIRDYNAKYPKSEKTPMGSDPQPWNTKDFQYSMNKWEIITGDNWKE